MSRPARTDSPGTWYHVMNRGVAHRAFFEAEADAERFLCRVQEAVDRSGLEVHAYALVANHFHLLVRSREGRISSALHLIQAAFAQWFNRTRDRDGPIHRSRFRSVRVDSLRYRRYLVRYIDSNPVNAGLARNPAEYRHCSAHHYAFRGGPAWLCRDWIEDEVRLRSRREAFDPECYPQVFPPKISPEMQAFLDDNPENGRHVALHADTLLSYTQDSWDRWMADRARSADGVARLDVVLPLDSVDTLLESLPIEERGTHGNAKHTTRDLLRIALGRLLAGATAEQLARRTGLSARTVQRLWTRARRLQEEDPSFAKDLSEAAETVTRWALRDMDSQICRDPCLAPTTTDSPPVGAQPLGEAHGGSSHPRLVRIGREFVEDAEGVLVGRPVPVQTLSEQRRTLRSGTASQLRERSLP